MPHVCALITIAMQLTCVVDKEILCTNNEYLTQLLSVPSCEHVFSHQKRRRTTTVEFPAHTARTSQKLAVRKSVEANTNYKFSAATSGSNPLRLTAHDLDQRHGSGVMVDCIGAVAKSGGIYDQTRHPRKV